MPSLPSRRRSGAEACPRSGGRSGAWRGSPDPTGAERRQRGEQPLQRLAAGAARRTRSCRRRRRSAWCGIARPQRRRDRLHLGGAVRVAARGVQVEAGRRERAPARPGRSSAMRTYFCLGLAAADVEPLERVQPGEQRQGHDCGGSQVRVRASWTKASPGQPSSRITR